MGCMQQAIVDRFSIWRRRVIIRIPLEPEALAFAQTTATPPFIFELGPEKGRDTLEEVQSGLQVELPANIEDLSIAGGPGGSVSIRVVRPHRFSSAQRPLPTIVYIHGAGWVFGGTRTHDRLIREIAVGAEAIVLFPDYSRSPEANYPTAIEESYKVLKWVAQHGADHGMDRERLAVAGDNVGGA